MKHNIVLRFIVNIIIVSFLPNRGDISAGSMGGSYCVTLSLKVGSSLSVGVALPCTVLCNFDFRGVL